MPQLLKNSRLPAFTIHLLFLAFAANAHANWSLGIKIQNEDEFGNRRGVRIVNVTPGQPAQIAGLEASDVILQIDGRNIWHVNDAIAAIRGSRGTVTLLIRDWRTGRKVIVNVALKWNGIQTPLPPPSMTPHPPKLQLDLAQYQVNQIAAFLRMPSIKTYVAPVNNAEAATILNRYGQRVPVIRYNSNFLNRLYREHGIWASLSVLAHEVAHHFNGDTGFYSGFAHPWTKELRADFVSGYVLAKAGATEEQSTRALKDQFNLGSQTHPDTLRRLEALVAGWRQGQFSK